MPPSRRARRARRLSCRRRARRPDPGSGRRSSGSSSVTAVSHPSSSTIGASSSEDAHEGGEELNAETRLAVADLERRRRLLLRRVGEEHEQRRPLRDAVYPLLPRRCERGLLGDAFERLPDALDAALLHVVDLVAGGEENLVRGLERVALGRRIEANGDLEALGGAPARTPAAIADDPPLDHLREPPEAARAKRAGMKLPSVASCCSVARALAQGRLPAGAERCVLRRRGEVVDELEREEVAALVDEHLQPVERPAGEALDERLADDRIELAALEDERAQVVDGVLELPLPCGVARRKAREDFEQLAFPDDAAQSVVVEAEEVWSATAVVPAPVRTMPASAPSRAAEVDVVGTIVATSSSIREPGGACAGSETTGPSAWPSGRSGSCGARGSRRRSARGRSAASPRTSRACSCPCVAGRSTRLLHRDAGREEGHRQLLHVCDLAELLVERAPADRCDGALLVGPDRDGDLVDGACAERNLSAASSDTAASVTQTRIQRGPAAAGASGSEPPFASASSGSARRRPVREPVCHRGGRRLPPSACR